MRRILICVGLFFVAGSVAYAQGTHRLGVGLGAITGTYTEPGLSVDMDGPLVDVPAYSYTFDSGLTLALQYKSLDIEGSLTLSGLEVTTFYKLTTFAFGVGFALPLSEQATFVPTLIAGSGSAEFHYEIAGFGSSPTLEGDGAISGLELPFYFDVNEKLYVGLKPGLYGGGSDITYPDGTDAKVELDTGFQFLIGAVF